MAVREDTVAKTRIGPLLAGAAMGLALFACNKAPSPAPVAANTTATDTGASADVADATDNAPPDAVSDTAPPALPEDAQPPIPAEGYIWTPGYWAWQDADNDYYWVPGNWVQPPQPDLLWTPGFWIFANNHFVFHRGHWGRQVGFYGGVDYGHGYGGQGYQGGKWMGERFYYNTAANSLAGAAVTNLYSQATSGRASRTSFNGGPGGVAARPTAAEMAAAHEPRTAPTPDQDQHAQTSATNPELRAKVNHGAPTPAPGAPENRPAPPRPVQAASQPAPERSAPPARPASQPTPPPRPAPQERPVPPRPAVRAPAPPRPAQRPAPGTETNRIDAGRQR